MTEPTSNAPGASPAATAPGEPGRWQRTAPVPAVPRRSRFHQAPTTTHEHIRVTFEAEPPEPPAWRGWIVVRAMNFGGTGGAILAIATALVMGDALWLLILLPFTVVLGLAGGLGSGALLAATRRGTDAAPRTRLLAALGAALSVVIVAPLAHWSVVPEIGYGWWLLPCAIEAAAGAAAGPFLATGLRRSRLAALLRPRRPSLVVTVLLLGAVGADIALVRYMVEHMFDNWSF
jgi:hypothetical protein